MSEKSKIFIKEEEKQLLVTLKSKETSIIEELGKVTLTLESFKNRKTALITAYEETKNQETALLKNLEANYGRGSVDRDTGEFFPL